MKRHFLLPTLLLALLAAGSVSAQLRYDTEYPAIGYSDRALTDPISQLAARIERGEVVLEQRNHRGYLDSLLEALDIHPDSQLLVWSKTSLRTRFISPETPRALYFNDEVYVAWTQGSSGLEIASLDPEVGPVFFTIANNRPPAFEREMARCLRCHDSYSLTGGGTPRFIMMSVLAGADGNIVSHEISEVTDTSTPIVRRWGGWYVSGSHGEQQHLGNLVIRDIAMIRDLDAARRGNLLDLSTLFDATPYLTQTSDIVPLLVVEHQKEVQNLITRVNYKVRAAEDEGSLDQTLLAELTEPLVRSLVMADEAPLADSVTGNSDFADHFQSLGPFDSQGRSLRQLDLRERVFRYPLSYLIYSRAFAALPEQVQQQVARRLGEILRGEDGAEDFHHLRGETGEAILAILKETMPSWEL